MPTRGWGILSTTLESSIVAVQALSCPTLWSNELQYIRLPCPSPSAGVCSNSCPLNQGCYLTSRPLPPSSPSAFNLSQHHGLFPMSRLFTSGGQSIGASATASVLSMNIQDWFPLKLTGLTSLLSKGLSRVFSSTTIQKHRFCSTQPSLWSNFHIHTWVLEKP